MTIYCMLCLTSYPVSENHACSERQAETTPKIDAVNNPPHYATHPSGIECIQVTRHMNFNLGNVIKYLWRAGVKTEAPIEDLRKARWYLDDEIKRLSA